MIFKDKVAIITGCNKGIGKAILENLSRKGATIFACSRKSNDEFLNNINLLQKKNGNKIYPVFFDLENKEEIKEAILEIKTKTNKIDMIVNNAGSIQTSIFQMTPEKKIRELFEINFFSQLIFTQHLLKLMIKEKNGSIVFISSTSSEDANFGRSIYSASKSAMNAISLSLSRELGQLNIRVNSVAPGLVDTEMANKNTSQEVQKNEISKSSLKRIGQPEEIASVVYFLLSDESSYLTGQLIRADGGL
jgi:3-oxoacyl-[acyl-carrier protein] reductase